jgi:hypothetical protein
MKLIEINGTVIHGYRFTSLAIANEFSNGCLKPHRVILGDHPSFWVVCPADAERLLRAGYEFAE